MKDEAAVTNKVIILAKRRAWLNLKRRIATGEKTVIPSIGELIADLRNRV